MRKRQNAQVYNVISNPPATHGQLAAGRIITGTAIFGAALHTDQAAVIARFEGKKGPDAACEVRIAVTQAILDNRLDDPPPTYRETRDGKRALPATLKQTAANHSRPQSRE